MTQSHDTILIVDDDPELRTLLCEQVFASDDYEVHEAKDGPDALLRLRENPPDVIVLDLAMPGLSGHDMLVALQSQGYAGPLIVMAENKSVQSAVEAFRLGATDYVTKPVREAEVLAAVERGLSGVRLRRQRDTLLGQLKETNQQLEDRVKELTTLYEIGESVTAMRRLDALFERVLEGALKVTGADHAMLQLVDERTGNLVLRAGKNLQIALMDRLGEHIRDQLSEFVMTSREALTVSGESLRRFTAARDLYAVAYVPLTVQNRAIGILAVGNHQTVAMFSENHARLLKILADYAAIAIVNARLFNILEKRARSMEATAQELRERDAQRGRQLQVVLANLHQPLVAAESELIALARGDGGTVPLPAQKRITLVAQQLRQLVTQISHLKQRPQS
jgi:two-component system NtrC family sensor kinase